MKRLAKEGTPKESLDQGNKKRRKEEQITLHVVDDNKIAWVKDGQVLRQEYLSQNLIIDTVLKGNIELLNCIRTTDKLPSKKRQEYLSRAFDYAVSCNPPLPGKDKIAAVVKFLLPYVDSSENNHHAFFMACTHGTSQVVEILLKDKSIDQNLMRRLISNVAQNGRTTILKLLIQTMNVSTEREREIALSWAAKHGHINMVDFLINETDVNPNCYDNGPLNEAISGGHLDVVDYLLKEKRIDSKASHDSILRAIEHGHDGILERLLQEGVIDPTRNHYFFVYSAIQYGRVNLVKILLKDERIPIKMWHSFYRYSDLNKKYSIVELLSEDSRLDLKFNQDMPLEACLFRGEASFIKKLLLTNRFVASANEDVALRWAVFEGDLELVDLLLRDKTVNAATLDNEAICIASYKGYTVIVERLLKEPCVNPTGAVIKATMGGKHAALALLLADSRVDFYSVYRSCLELAGKEGNLEILQLLFKHDTRDSKLLKASVLWDAFRYGHLSIVQYFIQHSISSFSHLPSGIVIASIHGYYDIVDLLLTKTNIDPGYGNNEAFIQACHNGRIEIVKLLASHPRVNPAAQYSRGFRLACAKGQDAIVNFLMTIKAIEPSAFENEAFIRACAENRFSIVKILVDDERVNPCARDSEGLYHASKYGHTNIVKFLLTETKSDPSQLNSRAFKAACLHGQTKVFEALYQDVRVDSGILKRDAEEILLALCKGGHIKLLRKLNTLFPKYFSKFYSAGMNEACKAEQEQILAYFIRNKVPPTSDLIIKIPEKEWASLLCLILEKNKDFDLSDKKPLIEFCMSRTNIKLLQYILNSKSYPIEKLLTLAFVKNAPEPILTHLFLSPKFSDEQKSAVLYLAAKEKEWLSATNGPMQLTLFTSVPSRQKCIKSRKEKELKILTFLMNLPHLFIPEPLLFKWSRDPSLDPKARQLCKQKLVDWQGKLAIFSLFHYIQLEGSLVRDVLAVIAEKYFELPDNPVEGSLLQTKP